MAAAAELFAAKAYAREAASYLANPHTQPEDKERVQRLLYLLSHETGVQDPTPPEVSPMHWREAPRPATAVEKPTWQRLSTTRAAATRAAAERGAKVPGMDNGRLFGPRHRWSGRPTSAAQAAGSRAAAAAGFGDMTVVGVGAGHLPTAGPKSPTAAAAAALAPKARKPRRGETLDPPLHVSDAANMTSVQAAHGMSSFYPKTYAKAEEAGRAVPEPNMNFKSAWGESLKNRASETWAPLLKTMKTVVDESVWGPSAPAGTPDEKLLEWLRRQRLYYADLLTPAATARLDALLPRCTVVQRREVLLALRALHAAASPADLKPDSHVKFKEYFPLDDPDTDKLLKQLLVLKSRSFVGATPQKLSALPDRPSVGWQPTARGEELRRLHRTGTAYDAWAEQVASIAVPRKPAAANPPGVADWDKAPVGRQRSSEEEALREAAMREPEEWELYDEAPLPARRSPKQQQQQRPMSAPVGGGSSAKKPAKKPAQLPAQEPPPELTKAEVSLLYGPTRAAERPGTGVGKSLNYGDHAFRFKREDGPVLHPELQPRAQPGTGGPHVVGIAQTSAAVLHAAIAASPNDVPYVPPAEAYLEPASPQQQQQQPSPQQPSPQPPSPNARAGRGAAAALDMGDDAFRTVRRSDSAAPTGGARPARPSSAPPVRSSPPQAPPPRVAVPAAVAASPAHSPTGALRRPASAQGSWGSGEAEEELAPRGVSFAGAVDVAATKARAAAWAAAHQHSPVRPSSAPRRPTSALATYTATTRITRAVPPEQRRPKSAAVYKVAEKSEVAKALRAGSVSAPAAATAASAGSTCGRCCCTPADTQAHHKP
jgi:hypothetical protein